MEDISAGKLRQYCFPSIHTTWQIFRLGWAKTGEWVILPDTGENGNRKRCISLFGISKVQREPFSQTEWVFTFGPIYFSFVWFGMKK